MNEAEKKALKMLSKEEQEEVLGGSDLTEGQCAKLRSKMRDPRERLLAKYGGPMPPRIDLEALIPKKPDNPDAE